MNPVLVLLILIGTVVLWFLLAGLYRLIGGITQHFIDNAKRAINDEPSNADAFVEGFKSSFKEKENE